MVWLQWIQSTLWERHGIRTLRRTLADFGPAGSAHLDEATGDLTVDGGSGVKRLRACSLREDIPAPQMEVLA